LIVELKAVETLLDLRLAQVVSYLRVTNLRLALLIKFTNPVMKGHNALRRVLNKYCKP
jgi:GxxExxY protein